MPSYLKPLSLTLLLAFTAGCSSKQTMDYTPAADEALTATTQWDYSQVQASGEQPNYLNDLIQEPKLDELITLALKNNLGLQQTSLALKIAYAQGNISSAARLPTLNAGFSGGRKQDQDTTYNADLTVSWELDIWQKLSNQVKASEMELANSESFYASARAVLAANVMRGWLILIRDNQLLAVEQQRLAVLEGSENLITQRYLAGLGSIKELDDARSSSASTRANLVEYQENLKSSERSLRQLLGLQASQQTLPSIEYFPDVIQVFASLPEQNLSQRPDLQQAYYSLKANQYKTQVAYKDMLPSISLSAALSDFGASPSEALFTSPAWSLLGQLTAPLFQGGRLRAQAEIAELTTEQAYLAFQDTLLTAITEVNNTLGKEQSLERQQEHLQEALISAERSASHYQAKYRLGLLTALDLISVQQKTFDLQTQLTQLTYNRLANRIDLGLALGLGVKL